MSLEAFVDHLQTILAKHEYPQKRVSLPLEKMYEVAHSKGLNFNKALELLRQRGVDHEKTNQKIIFFPKVEPAAEGGPEFSPKAMAEAMEMMKSLSPEQLQGLKDMVEKMSDEDKKAMLERARSMGLG